MKPFTPSLIILLMAAACSTPTKPESDSKESIIELLPRSNDAIDFAIYLEQEPRSPLFTQALDKYFEYQYDMNFPPVRFILGVEPLNNDSILIQGEVYPFDSLTQIVADYFKGSSRFIGDHWVDSIIFRDSKQIKYRYVPIFLTTHGPSLPYEEIQKVVLSVTKAKDQFRDYLAAEMADTTFNALPDQDTRVINRLTGDYRIVYFHSE